MNDKTNEKVVALATFEGVKVGDLRKGIICYSIVERQADELKTEVAVWMFNEAYAIWLECQMQARPSLEVLTKRMMVEIEYITSDAAGPNKLTKEQVGLSGNSSFANSYKRIKGGLDKGLSLDDFKSCSALAIETTRINKAASEALKAAVTEAGIKDAARAAARKEGVDPDTEVGKEFCKKKEQEINDNLEAALRANSPPANNAVAHVDAVAYKVPENLQPQADEILAALKKLTEQAIVLLIEVTPTMSAKDDEGKANLAKNQILDAINSKIDKWAENALKAHALAVKKHIIKDDVVEDEAAEDEEDEKFLSSIA